MVLNDISDNQNNYADKKWVVVKVGGSCLAGGDSLRRVNQQIIRLEEMGITPVIVVSALKGITDSLLEIAVNGQFQPSPSITDKILSEGEQMSVRIMQSTLEAAGLRVRALLLSDPTFPIVTDKTHGQAVILLEETESRIEKVLSPLLREGIIPIVPGFVGKTLDGTITTIGRGGSDTTAIVIGKALGVEEVILLKDVPGVLSGDPRVVDMPERLPSITVEECLDLAIKGGEVVCPLSLVYKPRDVNLRIVSYDSEDLLEGGTVVLGEIEREVKIYVKEGMAVVTVVGKRMNEVLGLLAEFSSTLCKEGINIYSVLTSNFSIGFYVDQDQRERAVSLLHDMVLGNRELSSVVSLSDLSIITVIGKTFADQPGLLAKIAVALAEEKIDLIDVSTTMEEFNLFVHMSDAKRAKRVLERVLNVGK